MLLTPLFLILAGPPPQEPPPPVPPGLLVIGRSSEDGVPEVPLGHPGSREVLPPEAVLRIGARDLNELVQHLIGLSSRPYNGGDAAAPNFSSRGLPDDGLTEYLHVLVDGVPANGAPYGWTAFSFLPLATERVYAVETIRGGHQVRFGPNTVGGVLNFLTRPVPSAPELETRQVYGSDGYASSFLTGGSALGDTRYRASVLQRAGDGYRADGAFRQRDASVTVRQELAGGWIAANVGHFEDEHQAPGGLSAAQFADDRFGNARPENRFEGARDLADFVWRRAAGAGWLEAFATASVTERHLFARREKTAGTFHDDWTDHTWFASLGARAAQPWDGPGGEHELFGGVRLHREWLPDYRVDSTPVLGGPTTRITDASFRLSAVAAHLDDTFRPTETIEVNAGVRAEWVPAVSGRDEASGLRYEDDFFALLPAAGASWRLGEEWALFGNWGEGMRAPQFWGLTLAAAPADVLGFERGRSAEAGLRRRGRDGIEGSVALWRLDFDDYLVFDTGFYENVGAIRSQGADLALAWELGRAAPALEGFSASLTATFQDSELEAGAFAGNEVPYAWDTKLAWRCSYAPAPGWDASLGGVYVGESFSDAANTAAESADGRIGLNRSWTVWDARLARRAELGSNAELELAVGAFNLFDTEWEVHSRGGFFGPGLAAGAPRQGYLSLSLLLAW